MSVVNAFDPLFLRTDDPTLMDDNTLLSRVAHLAEVSEEEALRYAGDRVQEETDYDQHFRHVFVGKGPGLSWAVRSELRAAYLELSKNV